MTMVASSTSSKKNKGKDSLNLIELPLTVFSKFLPVYSENTKENKIYIYAVDKVTKQRINGYLVITMPSKAGIVYNSIGPTEEDLIIALMEHTYMRGRERKVRFNTLGELIKLMGWTDGGSGYTRLIVALENLKAVQIKTDLFFDKQTNTYKTVLFNILDSIGYDYSDRNGRPIKGKKKSGFYEWNDILFQSFDDGWIKNLDTELYRSIKIPVARKLYRILDKRFYNYSKVYLPLEYLCVSILRLGKFGDWHYKRLISKYCEELINVGYLGKYWFEEHNGVTHAFFEKVGAQQTLFDPAEHINVHDPETLQVYEALLKMGLKEKNATDLMNMRDLKYVARWIDCIERGFMKANNKAGYIRTVLEKNHPLPQAYIDFAAGKLDEKRRAVTLDLIADCPLCDDSGFRYTTVVRDGKQYSYAVKCDHKQLSELPLFPNENSDL